MFSTSRFSGPAENPAPERSGGIIFDEPQLITLCEANGRTRLRTNRSGFGLAADKGQWRREASLRKLDAAVSALEPLGGLAEDIDEFAVGGAE